MHNIEIIIGLLLVVAIEAVVAQSLRKLVQTQVFLQLQYLRRQ
ncbi:hypothetical protein [Nostoc sp.]